MAQEIQITPFRSPLQLKSRFAKLRDLSDKTTIRIDDVDFRFEGPECGWLDVNVLRNGEEVYCFNMSDVYPPFEKLNRWLLSLLKEWPTSSIVHFDCERYDQEITCDFIGLWEDREKCKDVALFTFSADWEDQYDPAFLIVPVEEFVRKFYYGLLDYYISNKQVFMQDWGNECDWEDNHKLLDSDIYNDEISKRIPRSGLPPNAFRPSADIPIEETDAFNRIDALLSDSEKELISENPHSDEANRRIRDLGVWVRNNWIYSPDGEPKKVKDKRAQCYLMMSGGKLTYDYSWCFTDAHYVSFDFLDRYIEYLKERSN